MNTDELKQWLRDNLVITVESADPHGPNNSAYIGLRFRGEDYPFTSEHVYIPEREST